MAFADIKNRIIEYLITKVNFEVVIDNLDTAPARGGKTSSVETLKSAKGV